MIRVIADFELPPLSYSSNKGPRAGAVTRIALHQIGFDKCEHISFSNGRKKAIAIAT